MKKEIAEVIDFLKSKEGIILVLELIDYANIFIQYTKLGFTKQEAIIMTLNDNSNLNDVTKRVKTNRSNYDDDR